MEEGITNYTFTEVLSFSSSALINSFFISYNLQFGIRNNIQITDRKDITLNVFLFRLLLLSKIKTLHNTKQYFFSWQMSIGR